MRKTKLIGVLLFIGIFSILIIEVIPSVRADGCCFIKSQSKCETPFRPGTSPLDSFNACTIIAENKYVADPSCAGIPDCDGGCCCQGSTFIGSTNRAFCTGRGLPFTLKSTGRCTAGLCSSATPPCQPDCEFNPSNCLDKDQKQIASANKYFCSKNEKLYDFKIDCAEQCFPDIKPCARDAPITSECICDGEKNSGYCCKDGSYSETQESCPQNYCAKNGLVCSEGCYSQENPAFDFGQANGCPSEKPKCCGVPAPAINRCCARGEVCEGKQYTFSYSSCDPAADPSLKPCDGSCIRNPCANGLRINSPPNKNARFPECFCGEASFNTNIDNGFCCDNSYRPASAGGCGDIQKGSISGTIFNLKTGEKLPGTLLNLMLGGSQISQLNTPDGAFSFTGLEPGSYTIVVSKDGFVGASVTKVVSRQGQQLQDVDVRLSSIAIGSCDSQNPPSPIEVTVKHVKGIKIANLTWGNPCPGKINAFIISRSPSHPSGDIVTSSLFFEDNDVAWKDSFTYTVKAHYASNVLSVPATASITMGSGLCEGRFGNEEFCLDGTLNIGDVNTLGYSCGSQNNIVPLPLDCTDGKTKDAVCVGPDADGKVSCKEKINCLQVQGFKPFGLYYGNQTCVGHDGSNWCAYDYSLTSIDRCNECLRKDCFSYQSEAACLEDNCGGSIKFFDQKKGNSGCRWIYTWEEAGKGICYDLDFKGRQCERCFVNGSVFFNTGCNQQVCSALGNCFSIAGTSGAVQAAGTSGSAGTAGNAGTIVASGSCSACNPQTSCNDFNNKDACIGARGEPQSYSIGTGTCKAPVSQKKSNDACNLGFCRWREQDQRCIKDADEDNIDDCAGVFAAQGDLAGLACKLDSIPPSTKVQPSIPHGDVDGMEITFTSDEDADRLFYCVDETNTCCPSNPAGGLPFSGPPKKVTLNPKGDIPLGEGKVFFIRYYSVDIHKNVEQVKSVEIYVDRKAPNQYADARVAEGVPLSGLSFIVDTDEFVACTLSAAPAIPASSISRNDFLSTNIKNQFVFEANGLSDGVYTITTTCKDDVGNENAKTTQVVVDAVQEIRNPLPNFEIIKASAVPLSVETIDSSRCVAKSLKGGLGDIVLAETKVTDTLFKHSRTESFSAGTYHFEVSCTPVIGTKDPDSVFITFTVDNQAPATSVDKSGAPFDQNAFHRTPLRLTLSCEDPELGESPGEFGCSSQSPKYCISAGSCIPTTNAAGDVEIVGDVSKSITYFSADKGGNEEARQTALVKIDNVKPKLIGLTAVPPMTSQEKITIGGKAEDSQSGIKSVKVRVSSVEEPGSVAYPEVTIALDGQFSREVDLFEGLNTLIIVAEDNAGNREEFSTQVLRDVVGPSIQADVLDHNDVKVDREQVGLAGEKKNAEYGKKITFRAAANDNSEIKKVSVNLACDEASPSCQGAQQTFDLALSQGVYTREVTGLLPVGDYLSEFIAVDQFDNPNRKTASFSIKDTVKPAFSIEVLENGQQKTTIAFGVFTLKAAATEKLSELSGSIAYQDKVNSPITVPVLMGSQDGLQWTGTFNIGDNPNNQNIKRTLSISLSGKDINSLANSQVFANIILDTLGPEIKSIDPPIGGTVFFDALTLTGFTEPDSFAIVNVYPCSTESIVSCQGAPAKTETVSSAPNLPPQGLEGKLIEVKPDGISLPSKNDPFILFAGNLMPFLTPVLQQGNVFLDFEQADVSNQRSIRRIPRYRVQNAVPIAGTTRVEFTPGLKDNLLTTDKANTFTNSLPPGFFNVTVTLTPGFNLIEVFAKKDGKRGESVLRQVAYDPEPFTIALAKPDDQDVNINDFITDGNKIVMGIKTMKGGTAFAAACTVSHEQSDIVAKQFFDKPAIPEDASSSSHKWVISSASCNQNGGDYCLVGGTQQSPSQFHHYKIKCSSKGSAMPPVEKEVCFKAATRVVQNGRVYGQNICTQSSGCGDAVPEPCAEAPPQIDCSKITLQGDCTSKGCKFCPFGAAENANSCLASCGTCTGLPSFSNNVCVKDAGGGISIGIQ
ncbi:carboxypeptidase regulatory-like domain-containing protein [Candidatus Woesearchaeota archaeon]|nr:carboxypeptidase regulatory-like domain-containing protein [Candidatus Woesearchaeota archaeon]